MRSNGAPVAVSALGLAAALVTHQTLLGIATLGFGAPSYAAHAHEAVGPALLAQLALAALLIAVAVREALRGEPRVHRLPVGQPNVALAGVGIGCIAIATLFGMEFAESGTAALGLGWLGAQLFPGVAVLAAAVAAATSAFGFGWAGRAAAFERFIALVHALVVPVAAATRATAPRRIAPKLAPRREPPCARHAGLRAPPIPTT